MIFLPNAVQEENERGKDWFSRVWSSVEAEIRRCETAIFLMNDCKESITFWVSFSGEEGEKP